jgi:hypothetical protein
VQVQSQGPVCFAISLGSVWRDGQVTNTLFLNTHSIWNVDGGYEHVQHVHYRDNMYVFEGPSPEYGPQKYNQTSIELRGDFNLLIVAAVALQRFFLLAGSERKKSKQHQRAYPRVESLCLLYFVAQLVPLVLGTKSGSND